jgi:hypothetical protein
MTSATRRLGFVGTVLESSRQTLCLLCTRRFALLVAFGALCLGGSAHLLGGRVAEHFAGRQFFSLVAWWLLGTTIVPFGAIYLGLEAVHGPLEDRTCIYMFLRPVGRAPVLLGRWLACATVSAIVFCSMAIALFVGAAREDLWPDGVDVSVLGAFVETFVWGGVSYSAVAVLFAVYFRRPLIWAAGFVVGLQMVTANLPVSAGLRRLTLTDPLRRLLLDRLDPDPRLAARLWPAERSLDLEQLGSPRMDIAIFSAVCLVLAMWCHSRTEYESRTRE